jgi:hypothetical protein
MSQKIINTPNVFATAQVRSDLDANRRRIVFRNDDMEIVSDHSLPTFHPEEFHDTVQICMPSVNAQYVAQRQSETGKTITHKLGARNSTSSTIIGPTWNFTASGRRS